MTPTGETRRAALEAAPSLVLNAHPTYRFTRLDYFQTLDSTAGAWHNDNRYTPAGLSHALYVADGPDVALSEATQAYQAEFHTPVIPAHAVYPVIVTAGRVLDLMDKRVRDLLGVSLDALTGQWRLALGAQQHDPTERVITHDLGRAAFNLGWEAIRYPSARVPGRANLVLFTEHMAVKPEVRLPEIILEAQRLLRERAGPHH